MVETFRVGFPSSELRLNDICKPQKMKMKEEGGIDILAKLDAADPQSIRRNEIKLSKAKDLV